MTRKKQQYFTIREETENKEMQRPQRKKRYTYANQKGGVGKSTKVLSNGVAGVQSGKRVLVVDFDHGQGNTTYALGYTQWKLQHTTTTAITGDSSPEQALLRTYYDPKSGIFFDPRDAKKMSKLRLASLNEARRGPDLLPMNPDLLSQNPDIEFIQRGDWGLLLRNLLDKIEKDYDEVHIDTNPDVKSVFPKMAVYAATDIVVPSTPENWSVQGMIMLARFLMEARKMNEAFTVAGVVFSRLRYTAHREMIAIAHDEVIPAVNTLFAQTREGYRQANKMLAAQQVDGLHFECFEQMTSESKEYSTQTNLRSLVMTSKKTKKGEFFPALEEWQCYIELLKRTEGPGVAQAIAQYNALVKLYEAARD